MTLIVARNDKGRIAIAADTFLTEHDKANYRTCARAATMRPRL
jgi:hypothetical protein